MRFGLGCLRVFVDQSLEDFPATDPRRGEVDDGWPGVRGVGWALAAALVWPVLVVVPDELTQDSQQVPRAVNHFARRSTSGRISARTVGRPGRRRGWVHLRRSGGFIPRRPGSSWSQRNVAHVARLEAQERMLPSGRAAVEAAKADGRWAAAYAPPSEAEVPADLLAAIAADPAAQAMFDVLTRTNRFALTHRVNAVKRAQTRDRKIGEFVAMLARHETIYPQKAKPPNSPHSASS
jgi:hypothetical protein